MGINHIETTRADIKKTLSENVFRESDVENSVSGSGNFRLKATTLSSENSTAEFTHVELFCNNTQDKLFDFFTNESRFFYGWAKTGNTEYFICAEDAFGGQTVINLSTREMASYSPGEDGFILVDFHFSPDGKTLAVIGCYWACPYVIRIFDFSDPLNLPLKETREIGLLDNDEIIVEWLDNESFRTKGVKREKEPEYCGNGFRMKTLSEMNVQRHIHVDGTFKILFI